jgi:hypothetical protein
LLETPSERSNGKNGCKSRKTLRRNDFTALGGGSAVLGDGPSALGGAPSALGGDCAALGGGSSIVGGVPSVPGGSFAAPGGGCSIVGGASGALGGGPSVPGGGRRILECRPEALELKPDAGSRVPGFLGAAMANDRAGRAGSAWKNSAAGF